MWPFKKRDAVDRKPPLERWEWVPSTGMVSPHDVAIREALPIDLDINPALRPPKQEQVNWGEMSLEDCGRFGIEAFMGLVSYRHDDCSIHWWCAPVDRDLAFMVVFDQGTHLEPQGAEDYIAAYQYSITEFTLEGHPVYDPEPKLKMIINRMSDESRRILYGLVSPPVGDEPQHQQPLLDRANADEWLVFPRPVGAIPEDPSAARPAFLVGRFAAEWQVARVQHDEYGGYAGYRPAEFPSPL